MRIHRGIAAFYLLVFLYIVYAVVSRSNSSLSALWVVGFIAAMPIGLHLYAAQGASKGASWARTMSRGLGIFLLFGFPIGTVVGGIILVKTNKQDWQL